MNINNIRIRHLTFAVPSFQNPQKFQLLQMVQPVGPSHKCSPELRFGSKSRKKIMFTSTLFLLSSECLEDCFQKSEVLEKCPGFFRFFSVHCRKEMGLPRLRETRKKKDSGLEEERKCRPAASAKPVFFSLLDSDRVRFSSLYKPKSIQITVNKGLLANSKIQYPTFRTAANFSLIPRGWDFPPCTILMRFVATSSPFPLCHETVLCGFHIENAKKEFVFRLAVRRSNF